MSIEFLDQAADVPPLLGGRYISNLMHLVWLARGDLQAVFDLQTETGQAAYARWYEESAWREYGFEPTVPLRPAVLPESCTAPGGHASGRADPVRGLRMAWRALAGRFTSRPLDKAGANLIGYARAELGMGEHVRMTAASLATTDVPFGVVNLSVNSPAREKARLEHGTFIRDSRHAMNLLHVNADQALTVYSRLGRAFFDSRKNVLYPFWELARWPEPWKPLLNMFDEIWAPSRFIRNAIADCTRLPVIHMPVSVTLPPPGRYRRHHFGLPEDSFLFLFTFDFLSFIERKNPFASIRAFKRAFPSRQNVGLVLKVMNGDPSNPDWGRMLELIEDDPRIIVLDGTMDRAELLGLYAITDGYVSLHRSEGFGRGPAEAMYLGKPAVVTNYSGNTDFTLPDNSCLVGYTLVPVGKGQYAHERGQVWAEPDVEHAAWYMTKLVADDSYRRGIAGRGQRYVRETFDPRALGAKYRERLEHLARA